MLHVRAIALLVLAVYHFIYRLSRVYLYVVVYTIRTCIRIGKNQQQYPVVCATLYIQQHECVLRQFARRLCTLWCMCVCAHLIALAGSYVDTHIRVVCFLQKSEQPIVVRRERTRAKALVHIYIDILRSLCNTNINQIHFHRLLSMFQAPQNLCRLGCCVYELSIFFPARSSANILHCIILSASIYSHFIA